VVVIEFDVAVVMVLDLAVELAVFDLVAGNFQKVRRLWVYPQRMIDCRDAIEAMVGSITGTEISSSDKVFCNLLAISNIPVHPRTMHSAPSSRIADLEAWYK